jgi:hypothetical protein
VRVSVFWKRGLEAFVPAFSTSSGSHFWIDNHLRYVCVFEIAGGLGLCGLVVNVLVF